MLNTIERSEAKAWTIVVMLFLFSVINYFDKLVLGLAAVPIMKELDLSPATYGFVASSFFWLYAISGTLTGLFVVNRISAKWLLVALVGIWSAAQFPVAFTSSLGVLIGSRVLLGVGEGPGTPMAFHACHSWFASSRRNLPTAIVLQGTAVGFFVGSPLLTHIILEYGWRAAFVFCGGLGAAWVLAWILVGKDGPISVRDAGAAGASGDRPVSWWTLWLDRTMVGNYLLGFGSYWVVGLSIAWLAPYLRLGLGYDARLTGWVISLIAAAQPPAILAISFASQRMLQSGFSSRAARG